VVCCASQFASEPFDVVVSTEMLEHCRVWKDALWNMVNLLKPGGLMLLTWAGPGREAHGVWSSSPEDSPYTNDYYGELSAQEVGMMLQPSRWSGDFLLETRSSPADVYFYGVKS